MLRLRTFGTLHIARDGEVLTGAAQQRRLLALLAVLASAGQGGMSRDKLLALFWPEAELDKARRALNQSLYHIRRAADENLFLGELELRLNPSAISSDVGDFERFLADAALADAVDVYGGPFLDGFYLTSIAEFEEWTSNSRAKYAARYIGALDELARSAKVQGDRPAEAKWRRIRVDADASDGAAIVALMECLIDLGNRADALSAAQMHEERMLAAFELPADPGVVKLARSIRAVPPGEAQLAGLAISSEPTLEGATNTPVPAPEWRQGRRHPILWAIATSVVLVTAALVVNNHLRQDRARDTSVLVIAPFHIDGSAGPDKAYLAEGLLDLLSTRLAAADGKRTADAGRVLTAWRSAGFGGSKLPTSIELSRVAQSLGGRLLVTGSVASEGHAVSVHVEMLDVDRKKVIARVAVHGSADSLGSIVDRIVTGLVLGEAGEGDRVPNPPSLQQAALRTYLQGGVAYRRGDYQEATRYFSQSVANDPTFALAALELAIAADRSNATEQHDRGLALAWAGRAELSQRDSEYLVAFAGPRYPAPSPATEHLAAWQRAVQLDPTRPDTWFELGQSYFYDGKALGISDNDERAEGDVRQALTVDPTFAPAARLLPIILVHRGDVSALSNLLRRSGTTKLWGDLRIFLTWRTALFLGSERSLKSVRAEFPAAPTASLRAIALASQIEGIAPADGDRALELLRKKATTDREILDALLAMHSRAENAGDMQRVELVMADLHKTEPAFHVDARLRVLDALYGGGDRAGAILSARALVADLASDRGATPADSAVRVADVCVLGQWHVAEDDTLAVRADLKLLRNAGVPTFPVPIGSNPMACADILAAAVAGPNQARGQLAHADSLLLSGPAVGSGLRQGNLILARLFERDGDDRAALETLGRWQYRRGWPRYRNTTLREEGRLARVIGDSVTARWAVAQLALLEVPIGGAPTTAVVPARGGARKFRFGIR